MLAAYTSFLPRGAIVAVLMYPLVLEGVGLKVIVVAELLDGVRVTLGPGLLQHVLEGDLFHVILIVDVVFARAVSLGAVEVHHMIMLMPAPV